jgi:uncharacterized membrane protein YukC
MGDLIKPIYTFLIILILIINLYTFFLKPIYKIYMKLIRKIKFNFFDYLACSIIILLHLILIYITVFTYK